LKNKYFSILFSVFLTIDCFFKKQLKMLYEKQMQQRRHYERRQRRQRQQHYVRQKQRRQHYEMQQHYET
jgi:hypothetical protein